MSSDIAEDLEQASLRAEVIIHLPSMIAPGTPVPSEVQGAFEDNEDEFSELLGIEFTRDMEEDALAIYESGKRGFLVEMATPVPHTFGKTSHSFSWGHYQCKWFYAAELEEIYRAAILWQSAYMSQKREEASAAVEKTSNPTSTTGDTK